MEWHPRPGGHRLQLHRQAVHAPAAAAEPNMKRRVLALRARGNLGLPSIKGRPIHVGSDTLPDFNRAYKHPRLY